MKVSALLFVVLVIGIGLGKASEDATAYPVTKTITETEVKVKTNVVEKKVFVQPQVCADAVTAAQRMEAAVAAYEEIFGDETKAQEDSYQALSERDHIALNKAVESHRKVMSATTASVVEMQAASEELRRASAGCREYPVK